MTITSDHAAVARYADLLVRLGTDNTPELRSVRTAQLGDHVRCQLRFQDAEAVTFLQAICLWDEKAPFHIASRPGGLRKSCCQRAFLKGAFLACGWIRPPEKGYHIELAASDEQQAENLVRVLGKCGVPARITPRKSQYVVYFQEGELVSTFLKLIGAPRSVFHMEDTRMIKEIRNSVNRQVNCDARNLEAVISTAQRQLEDIRYLHNHGGLQKLPAPLRQIAEARLQYTDASYAELGELLDPPIGKSGVNNRLRRLSALADARRSLLSE